MHFRRVPGWLLDGFDFTILTFLLVDISAKLTINKALAGALGTVTLMFRLVGGVGAGAAADRWGRKEPADVFDPVVLAVRVPRRLFDVIPNAVRVSRAVRHRHGRGLGGGHAARDRALAAAAARHVSGMLQSGYSTGFMLSALVFQFVYPLLNGRADFGWRVMLWSASCRRCWFLWIMGARQGKPGLARASARSRTARRQRSLPLVRLFRRDLIGTTSMRRS